MIVILATFGVFLAGVGVGIWIAAAWDDPLPRGSARVAALRPPPSVERRPSMHRIRDGWLEVAVVDYEDVDPLSWYRVARVEDLDDRRPRPLTENPSKVVG